MSEEATLDEYQSEPETESSQEWQAVKLEDVSRKRSDNVDPQEVDLERHVGLEHIEPNTPYPKWEPLDGLSSTKRRFESGDILFAKLRPNLEKSAQPNFEGVASTDIFPIVAEQGINSKYLLYRLSSKPAYDHSRRTSVGTRMPRTSWNLFGNFEFDLPPLEEQRKIATVLYTVDQAIQKTEEIVEQTNRVKEGLIQRFYSRGYRDYQDWQQVDMQDAYVMSRTQKMPAEWNMQQASEIAEIKTGHTPSTSIDEYWNGGISWVDIHDLTQLEGTEIHNTDDTITEAGLNNSGAKLLPEGTLVLCRTGAIGATAILGKEMATDQDQVTFECDESKVLPRYLMYLFEYATPQLERLSAGSTHDKVQLHFFSDLQIPLPEIDEQREIVNVLKSVDEVSQSNKEQLDNLRRFKQGLMQDLLSGTVRTHETDIDIPDEVLAHG